MKAVRFHEYGGPEVLNYEDAPMPEAGAGEVLVRVHATSVNPVDWKIRAGYLRAFREYPLPFILGWDVSGVVESVGPGITQWKAGDEVFGKPDLARNGAYAEYVAVREGEIARKPEALDHVHAAALPLAGLTAWQALFDVAELKAGQKVLIHAAAGGVGSLAVQFAKLKGLFVAGTASGRNQSLLKELGVDQPVDYETTRFEDVVQDADAVVDALGGETRIRSWKALKKGGIVAALIGGPPTDEGAKALGVRQTVMWVQPNQAELAEIGSLAASGKIRVLIDAVLPLQEAARAHEMSQTERTRGKIVLEVENP
jgi:NADPH:quinone reductase-like Zn-dependent oxidoreductase